MSASVLVDMIPELILLGTALVVVLGGLILEPNRFGLVPGGVGRTRAGAEPSSQAARAFASGAGLVGTLAPLITPSFQASRPGSEHALLHGPFALAPSPPFFKSTLL